MGHKAGFVNIIGKPNVGKSTLMNAMVGEKLSIITYKAQTTRHRILGIVSSEDFQIVYSDTPGILDPHYKLHASMMKFVEGSIEDADVFLYVAEVGERNPIQKTIDNINNTGTPILMLVNKIDKIAEEALPEELEFWQNVFPKAIVIPVSALRNANLDKVFEKIIELLPESPPYYPKDELTDKSMRFIVSEIIREKIFLTYKQEIPYSTEVIVETFKEEEKITRIMATIYIARDSQKGILIGHQGKSLKKVGTEARLDIEQFLKTKVFLELHVKVSKDWRDNQLQLKRFGYEL
ncbi:MAG: GTPase Era [Bacteroidales bacterium]|jgi:GTP-binding protein Era|nr:GTPase Era [Bacteroidales bacterium]